MAKNITQKDIEYLDSVIAKSTYGKHHEGYILHGEFGTSRFMRVQELGLIELGKIDGSHLHGWKPSVKGLEAIKPLVEARQAAAEKRATLEFERKQQIADMRKELAVAGVDRVVQVELSILGMPVWSIEFSNLAVRMYQVLQHYDVGIYSYSVGIPIDTAALIEEARQAQIACDLLNSRLPKNKGE